VILSCRILVCIGMSYWGGLTNRIAYAPTKWVLLRDLVACTLENNLVLISMESVVANQSSTPRRSISAKGSHKRMQRRQWGCTTRLKRLMQQSFAMFLSLVWIFASWGDYVFESEAQGTIPTMWIIAPGLKDPTLHARVQLNNHKNIFLGGLARCILGLCIGIIHVYALIVRQRSTRHHSSPTYYVGGSKKHSKNRHKSWSISIRSFRHLSDTLQQQNVVAWNVVMLIISYGFGAWAPLTNLIYCTMGILLFTPPGGGSMMEGTVTVVATRRGAISKAKQSKGAAMPPNVVIVVHESLSGAAMQSPAGIDAAPFFHSMRSDPNFYDFKYARTIAATTPIATPGLLTGLMPYTDEGVDLVKRASLASEFKQMGYDTGSFVAYGADWTGNAWWILTYLLVPNFDAVFDPKATGDELVNEYGMDDRVMVNHFRGWLQTRRGPGNSNNNTAAAANSRKASDKNETTENPFFALVVQNNNHFPFMRHASYSGDPECDKKERERESNTVDNGRNLAEEEESPWQLPEDSFLDVERSDFDDYTSTMNENEELWGESYGPSCGFTDVSKYYSSIRTSDEALEGIFSALNESGLLNNTILVGAGDHGEVPGVLERMSDVNAPLLSIPLWMYIPRKFLPDRAYRKEKNGGVSGTYLRDNVDRGVSILDVVPTLRDLFGYDELYSSKEEKECVVGQSLLSQPVLDDRVMISWQGLPLQGHQIGIFSTASDALIYYKKDPETTKHIDYRFNPGDIFFNRSESLLADHPEKARHWKDMLQQNGLLSHGAVKKWMPGLGALLEA